MTADIILIDLSGIWWAAWHATADKPLGEAFEITCSTVRSLAEKHKYCAVCGDHAPYKRKALAPTYKAQRDAPEPNAIEQFTRVKKRLVQDGFVLWSCEGYEADDVIATAVNYARADGLRVVIASSDKDLLQLIDEGTTLTKPNGTLETFDVEAVQAKFGVGPHLMRDLLALWGDASDNIPGVPGIGPKIAAKLLHDFGDIDHLLAHLDRLPPGKTRESIFANADQLRLSRKLVTLMTDAPIVWAEIYEERVPQKLTEGEDMDDIDESENFDSEPEPIETTGTKEAPKIEDTTKPKADALATINSSHELAPPNFEQGLQPGSLGAAYKLARGLYESRLYSRFPNPEAIWAVIIRGREMGLGALTALDSFHVIEGRPCPSAHLLIARAKQHPDCEFFQFLGGDDKSAEYETKNRRNPKPTRLRYTLAQAEAAGITKSQRGRTNWEKRPAEMIRKTCAIQLARIEYPEALLGAYAAEEME